MQENVSPSRSLTARGALSLRRRCGRKCPSALGRRRRIDGTHLAVPPSLRVTELAQVGAYGLHITFSADARGGVYPWPMLTELSLRLQVDDFIAPAP